MRFVLLAKSWQLFGIFILYFFSFASLDFYLSSFVNASLRTNILTVWFLLFYFYPVLVGYNLFKILSDQESKRRFNLVKIGGVILAVMIVACILIGNEWWKKIPIIIQVGLSIIGLYCYSGIFLFAAWALQTLELKRSAGIWEYIVDGFQFWCWPLCIWWIHPRIRKVCKSQF